MLDKLLIIVGMVLIVGVTYLCSTSKKEIKWRSIGIAFFAQMILAFLFIKTPLWKVIEWVSAGVSWILAQSTEGIEFVFGGLTTEYVFFLNALLPIVFISAIMGMLFHFNVLQKFISVVGKVLAKGLRISPLVAVNALGNAFLGQTESLFLTKSYLSKASDNIIFAMMVGGMTSISVGVLSLYLNFASIEWVIASIPLTVVGTFILSEMLHPTQYVDVKDLEVEADKGINVIETMMAYANIGFKSVIGISVALMVFLSVVSMTNGLLGMVNPTLSLEAILSIPFQPVAYLMGVRGEEIQLVSEILATKLVTNEAVAFGLPQFAQLSANAKAMMTVTLCGFAGVGSVGILSAGVATIAPSKVSTVARLGFKALLTATFVNILTGMTIALFL